MKRLFPLVFAFLIPSAVSAGEHVCNGFLPPNDLHLQELDGGITEARFNAVLDRTQAVYGPIFQTLGATLTINRRWTDNTVNASAEQPSATTWRINMYGGLARRPEVTEDGFAMVVCHELGHHLGGYPYVQSWAANEGQSDMHATGACAFKLFAENAELANKAQEELPADMIAKCDAAHATAGDRAICYRALLAGKSLASLLAALGNSGPVNFNTPDTSSVTRTNNQHPAAQCRLDSYVAGALCGAYNWDYALIPGKNLPNRNSMDAQNEAYAHSCPEGAGSRPRCWFAPLSSNAPDDPATECPLGDPMLCDLICQIDPSQPWCNNITVH